MEQIIIDNLIHQGENERLVYISHLDEKIIAQEICAFLNTNGGDIIIGLNQNDSLINIEYSKNIEAAIRNSISPLAPFSMNVFNYHNRNIVLINVWPGGNKPYSFNGIIYAKEGRNTLVASNELLGLLNAERKNSEFHWERQTVLGAELEDLDINEITKTLQRYIIDKPEQRGIDVENFLSRLGLIKGGSLTNAAIVLFGNNPTRFLPQCRMRVTIYERNKDTNTFLFDRLLEGNLFRNFNTAYEILETYIKKSTLIDGIYRNEKGLPRLALREGLMNALVHRDYSLISGNLTVEIFSDKVEITNSGELLSQIKVLDLKKEHGSYLRNPDIAKVCFIRGLIEMLGTGTIRMISDCKINGLSEPDWVSENNTTKLIFPGLTHQITSEGVNEGVNEGVFQEIEGVNEGVKNELISIMNILKIKPLQKANEIAVQLNKGVSTVERYLKILKDNDLIEFDGAPKTGGYRLK